MMRLHMAAASPFARKVVVVLHETGQFAKVEIVPAAGTPTEPGTLPLRLNPLGKIPALERPDGPTLYDSRVICRYFADLAGEPSAGGLYPAPPRLWETLTLETTGDGICEAAVLMIYEGRTRPEELRSSAWVESQWSKVERAVDAIEERWMSHLLGPLDVGQIAIGCALGYLDFRHGTRDWRSGHPNLSSWKAEFAQRPSMQASRPA
jgi:glutathione S-transferase